MRELPEREFEVELRKLKPAQVPISLQTRLLSAKPAPCANRQPRSQLSPRGMDGWRFLRWLVPATGLAVVLVAAALLRHGGTERDPGGVSVAASTPPPLRADDVQFDRRLVAAYDAVAELPGGEPVRFRCREWSDGVVLKDSARGIEIEQRRPHFEAVPVRFETY